ncbi:uncharacterized protein LOC118201946 [Stegodyphus dumicola]|uniref:uncharacterized protein LOC118201946 n=1 Tax=Stegodyphus dumicola TaxID=202533 RepID=UPI0015AEFF25|nr:uncharacterized protein LOC118201946 [Stegodyphus dumicola]
MEVFNFVWISLLNEAERCNVFFSKKNIKSTYHADVNFFIPQNRLAYMYKYGAANIMFMKQCIVKFLTESPQVFTVLGKIRSTENLRVCSLSLVPGFDLIGLLYGFVKNRKPITQSVNLSVINKCDSWENVIMNMLFPSLNTVYPVAGSDVIGPFSGTFDMIIDDVSMDLSVKTQNCLRAADVVLMVKAFSSGTQVVNFAQILENILHLLKPGALLFFVGNQKKADIFVSTGSCGNFLYGPVKVRVKEVPFISKVSELIKSRPDQTANGYFAIWEKTLDLNKTNPGHSVDASSVILNEQESSSSSSSVSGTSQSAAVENNTLYNVYCQQGKLFQDNAACGLENVNSVTVGACSKISNDENRSMIKNNYEDILSQVDSVVSHLEKFKNSECLKNIKQNHSEGSPSSYHLCSTCLCSGINFHCDHPHPSKCDHPHPSKYYRNDYSEEFCMSNSCCCVNMPLCRNNIHCQNCASRLEKCNDVLIHSIHNVPYISIPVHKVSKENLKKIFSLVSGTVGVGDEDEMSIDLK